MALTKRAASTPKTEDPAAAAVAATPVAQPETVAATPAAAPAPAPAASPAAAPPPVTALAVPAKALTLQRPNALLAMKEAGDFLASLKDALPVNWNTLTRLKCNQGRITAEISSGLNLGDFVEFDLLSFQANWAISPGGDSDEAKSLARYSKDGVNLEDDDRSCREYLQYLKEMGYDKAKMAERVILVASLVDCEKNADSDLIDSEMLFQIDLAPTSKGSFDTYMRQAAFDLSKGKVSTTAVLRMRGTCSLETQRGGMKKEYTKLNFTRGKTAVAE